MQTSDSRHLGKCTILLTRPPHQSKELHKLLEQQGAKVLHFPVIEIVPVSKTDTDNYIAAQQIIARLDDYDIAIFISSNAVEQAVERVSQIRAIWPDKLKLAAIGDSTTRMLEHFGMRVDIQPATTFNSEALLAMSLMQNVQGKNIVIFRGIGGRETLAEVLRQRGARVDYAEVYVRQRPSVDLSDLTSDQRKGISAIIVASNESLQNLYDMAGTKFRQWLLNTPMVLISQRCGALANKLKFRHYIVAKQASNIGLLNAAQQCCEQYPVEDRDD